MFLFLSKLLPLFVYPVGLCCLLLLLATWLHFKRSRRSYIPILLVLLILAIAGNTQVANKLMVSLEQQYLPQEQMAAVDAIVVLGGATRNNESPRILPDMNEHGDRLLYAAKLFKDGVAPRIVLSGGRIQWYGGASSEAESMAEILELMGIPRSAFLLESKSLNTHDNAVLTKKVLAQNNLQKVALVTSAFHMPRSMAIFRREGIEAVAAPADYRVSDRNLIEHRHSIQSRILGLIPNSHNLELTTLVLKEYIGTLIYRLKGWI